MQCSGDREPEFTRTGLPGAGTDLLKTLTVNPSELSQCWVMVPGKKHESKMRPFGMSPSTVDIH